MTPAWQDLDTRGYVVVPGFLSPELVQTLLEDFQRGAQPETFPFGFKPVGRRALAAVMPRLENALEEIRQSTSQTTDVINFLTLSHYVVTRLAQRTSNIHQDFDLDYRLSGDHLNYLNFWIPVRKPEPERSNLCLLPFDRLQERSPEAFRQVRGGGGLRWQPAGGRTAVYGPDESKPRFWLDFDAEDLMVTPHTEAGDLILMRGDLPHRTQDQQTDRLAASIRATASSKRLSRDKAVCSHDDPAASIIGMLQRCLQELNREEVSVGEFVDFAQGRR